MTYVHLPHEQRLDLYTRLKARYGEERANLILTDRDPQANTDIQRWRELGQRRAATC
jgi:hypothetical protein